ncbi:MAG: alkaline phosphatase family protein [Desulfuromonadales bacterium]|nr:alkaline phosphatase family protein [Desulfuromonadales bacterium]
MSDKFIFIGIDGMDPTIAEQMMDDGHLPNFSRLKSQGQYDRLTTTNPPQSPVVWATIATGANPGEHGVFDFIERKPGTYIPSLSLFRIERGQYQNPVRSITFWERISSEGISASLLKWPMGFPPRYFEGKLLAGLGVPDIKGMLGTYTLFTTVPETFPADAKGRIVPVVPHRGRIDTEIHGPYAASLRGRKEVTCPLKIMVEGEAAHFLAGKQQFSLREGEWSNWHEVTFDVGLFRSTTGLCRFYLKKLNPEFVLYMTPVNVGYESSEFPISTPSGFARELSRQIEPFATLGMAEDTNAFNDGVLDEDEFLALCSSIMDERERMFFHELSHFKKGLLACVFDTTDRIQHMFWRMRDSGHPLYNEDLSHRYGDVISGYYRRMDRIIGTVMERFPDACLAVCSDHGFSTFRRAVHLNTWLVENGFMVLKSGAKGCEGLFDSVDWSKTKAYAIGFTSLYLNVHNREKSGSVLSEEISSIKRSLSDKLTGFYDRGQRVIHEVHDSQTLYHGPEQPKGPDLVVGYSAGYRASWQTAVGGVPDGPIIEDNLKKWSGDHCCDASFVPGVFFSNARVEPGIRSVLEISGLIEKHFGGK